MRKEHIKRQHLFVLIVAGILFLLLGCTKDSDDSSGDNSSADQEYAISDGRFSVNLRTFNSGVLEGYNQCEDLASDLEEAGKLLANLTIAREKEQEQDLVIQPTVLEDTATTDGTVSGENTVEGIDTAAATSELETAAASDESSDFETNTQVEGVDEGDIVKSDGQFVYIAYGDELVVHDLAGNILDRQSLPAMDESGSRLQGERANRTVAETSASGSATSSDGTPEPMLLSEPTTTDGGITSSSDAVIEPALVTDSTSIASAQEQIQALLLDQGRILAVSSGYQFQEDAIISNTVRLFLYEVSEAGTLNLLEEKEVKGWYQATRELDGTAYVVALANLNNYQLTGELSRFNTEFRDMGNDEYEQAALEKSKELIPEWRDKLMQELFADANGQIPSDGCQHIAQVSRMGTSGSDAVGDLDLTDGQGVVNGLVQIISFDMSEGVSAAKTSGSFIPTTNVVTYANADFIILGGQRWQQFTSTQWQSSSFLMAFSIDTGEAVPASIGEVEGRILNQFSLDVHEGHLRVASTIEEQWNYLEDTWKQINPSESQVTILSLQDTEMEVTGEVRGLGEGEQIYATRFIGNRGFVVTFETIDPFYTLDLSSPTNPQLVGELKISGFSNYLHPVGDDHILAIGQEADEETGQTQGLQVALFDVSDFANPVQKYKHVVDGWSSSSAQGDHRAFRYLESQETLILPLSNATTDSLFDGFQIYKVSVNDGIELTGQITHVDVNQSIGCYSSAYLSPRSLVFDDQLVTLKGHAVLSYDFSSLEKQWGLELDQDQPQENCYPWFDI